MLVFGVWVVVVRGMVVGGNKVVVSVCDVGVTKGFVVCVIGSCALAT